jgi:CubicO group peptidase (beta-lactamase class C family)
MPIHAIDVIKHNLPAAIVTISESGNRIHHYCAGVANVSNNTPLTENYLFQNGKITRTFTAVGVLRLVEAGLVDLDAPLELIANRHRLDGGRLKIIIDLYPVLKPLTLRELLNQSSGLPAYDETISYQKIFFSNPKKIWQAENYLDLITEQEVRYRAGYELPLRGVFSDSATNYILVTLVLEAITGRKNSELMQELFMTLGLKNTFYLRYGAMDETIVPRLARGYLPLSHPHAQAFHYLPVLTYNHNRELRVYDVTTAYNLHGLGGSASVSNTTDLIHLMKMLVSGKILTSSFKEMFNVIPVNPKNGHHDEKTYFGLGIYKTVSRRYGEIIWNAGNSYGYGVLVAHSVDRDITFAFATNISRQYIYLQNKDIVSEVIQQIL